MSHDASRPGAGQEARGGAVRTWAQLLTLACCLPACYEQVKPHAGAAIDVAAGTDAGEDLATATGADAPIAADAPDASPDLKAACPGGAGCVCDKPSECDSGFCLATAGGSQCAQICTTGCNSAAEKCVSASGSDVVNVCVAFWDWLCDPCSKSSDCNKTAGLGDALCVDHAGLGGFCGVPCQGDDGCPTGYRCGDVTAVDGPKGKQCVPKSASGIGECACSAAATKAGLSTTCAVPGLLAGNPVQCTGKRVCGAGGLTACDAPSPGTETCDGKDNDCDGLTDEQLCDDGEPCTKDACELTGACKHVAVIDGTGCPDSDACTSDEVCSGGKCLVKPANCDDGKACTQDGCDPSLGSGQGLASGCTHTVLDGKGCDADGNACTEGDVCQGEICTTGTAKNCDDAQACTDDSCDATTGQCSHVAKADGVTCEDGSACTSNDGCLEGKCKGKPVDCNDGNPCTSDGCDVVQGCVKKPVSGTACDDADPCTTGDTCQDGACAPGGPATCPAGGACIAWACDPVEGKCAASYKKAGTVCSDANPCTSGDVCGAKGVCGGEVIVCDDNNPCTEDSCSLATGCTATDANGKPCDADGSACTAGDACQGGKCAAGPAKTCDDGNPCTVDACDGKTGLCGHVAVGGMVGCDDGNACTAGDACKNGGCVGGTNTCACTKDVDCAGFEDGNLCNGTLICDTSALPYKCKVDVGTVISCSTSGDGPCQKTDCVPGSGKCLQQASAEAKSCDADGSVCTSGDTCKAGACQAGPPLGCDDGNACTTDSCDATLGCVHVTNTGACDADGSVCTVGDVCKDKVCLPGAVTACDDGNACTDDNCDKIAGCTHAANAKPCDADGSVCSKDDACSGGACLAGATLGCDDGNPCTDDSCDKTAGCKHSANTSPCDADGSVCTQNDVCQAGICTAGAQAACNDGNACTKDACDAKLGCAFPNLPDNSACDDGNGCTTGDKCTAGKCGGVGKSCDDGNACTKDACSADKCSNTFTVDACDDADNCTQNDVCDGKGACSGKAISCDDGKVCTDDLCVKGAGCSHPANAAACDDGSACTLADKCAGGACAGGTAVVCDDKNPCTDDSCDKVNGCTTVANSAPCDDGNACTTGDACKGAACVPGSSKLFNATYGGSGDDYAQAVTALADGGLALVGSTASTNLPGGQKTTGDDDLWLVRTGADGKVLWNQTYGGSLWDFGTAVTALPDGGLALAGFTDSVDLPDGHKSVGGYDFWLVRTDASGKLLWNQTYGGSGDDYATALIVLANGDLVLVGRTNSTNLPGGQKFAGVQDIWMVRTDADGKLLWSQTYGGSNDEIATAVTGLADGGLAVAGGTQSTDLPGGQKSLGLGDFWLVRTDAGGKLLWNQTYGGTGNEWAAALTVLADGGLALAGLTESTDLPGGQKSAGSADFWLVRTDAAGKLLWNQTYGGSGWDNALALTALADGGLALAGGTQSTDLPGGQKTAGSGDFLLVRTDAGGKLLWNRTYGGSGNDFAQGVTALADSSLALVGRTPSTDLPGGQKSLGGWDSWLVRTDPWGHASCAEAGGCFGKTMADCDDKNLCTDDSCDKTVGCAHNANTATCSDNNACTVGDVCAAGTCKAGALLDADGDGYPAVSCGGTDCDDSKAAVNPAATEVCNGLDDNCDNKVDPENSGSCKAYFIDSDSDTYGKAGSASKCLCTADGASLYTSANNTDCNDGVKAVNPGVAESCAPPGVDDNCNGQTDEGCVPETCNGVDDDGNGKIDDVVCGSGACTCAANGVATCPSDCAVCPDDGDLAIPIDDAGVKKVVCAHDYPAWGNQPLGPTTFADKGDGTVVDSLTGLAWQKAVDAGAYTWAGAKTYCDGLVLAGKSDWRAPTSFELETTVDYTKTSYCAVMPAVFGSCPCDYYRAATPFQGGSSFAWVVYFNGGGSSYFGVAGNFRVRCVR